MDAAGMKLRMRADLRDAMSNGRKDEARLIRSLIAAIDNAEAPVPQAGQLGEHNVRFQEGSAEIARLELDKSRLDEIIRAEIEERERAAAEMDRVGRPDLARTLNEEAALARRYLEERDERS